MPAPAYARKSGQIMVVSGPVTNQVTGDDITVTDDTEDYAPGTMGSEVSYAKDQRAKLSSGEFIRAVRAHTATPSDANGYTALAVTAGALTGSDKDDWEIVSGPGVILRGLSFTYSGARATEDEDFLEDEGTATTITSTSVTGTYEFQFDRNNQWHHLLDDEKNEFTVRIFPDGPVVDGRFLKFRIQNDPSITVNKTRANTSISFTSQGSVERRKVAAADLVGLT